MADKEKGRRMLNDISNNVNGDGEHQRRKYERNRRQREARERRKNEETPSEREERLRKQREYAREYYHRRKKCIVSEGKDCNINGMPVNRDNPVLVNRDIPCPTNKENDDPDDNVDWLHRNDNYVRRNPTFATDPLTSEDKMKEKPNVTPISAGGAWTRDNTLKRRQSYHAMDAAAKELLLQKKRDYSAKRRRILAESVINEQTDGSLKEGYDSLLLLSNFRIVDVGYGSKEDIYL